MTDYTGNTGKTHSVTSFTGSAGSSYKEYNLSSNFSMATTGAGADGTVPSSIYKSKTYFDGTISRGFEKYSLALTAASTSQTQANEAPVGGAESLVKISATASMPLDFGLTISGTAFSDQFSNFYYIYTNADTSESTYFVADGTKTGFSGSAKFVPTSWLYVTASASQETAVFANFGDPDEDQVALFMENVPDIVNKQSLEIGLSTAF
jgi:hypothetical protein